MVDRCPKRICSNCEDALAEMHLLFGGSLDDLAGGVSIGIFDISFFLRLGWHDCFCCSRDRRLRRCLRRVYEESHTVDTMVTDAEGFLHLQSRWEWDFGFVC